MTAGKELETLAHAYQNKNSLASGFAGEISLSLHYHSWLEILWPSSGENHNQASAHKAGK